MLGETSRWMHSMDVSDSELPEMGVMSEKVDAPDVEAFLGCRDLCEGVGKACDGMYQDVLAGRVAGVAYYSQGAGAPLDCERVPELMMDNALTGESLRLERVSCCCLNE